MVNRTRVASVILLVLGIACLVASLLLIFLGDSFIKNSVKKVRRSLPIDHPSPSSFSFRGMSTEARNPRLQDLA